MSKKHRIFIVDDHPIMRQGLGQLINNEPDLELVGEASDALSGQTGVLQSKPKLVVIDISAREKRPRINQRPEGQRRRSPHARPLHA
jgi:DNA-binding NarL/FixJ family response regulator